MRNVTVSGMWHGSWSLEFRSSGVGMYVEMEEVRGGPTKCTCTVGARTGSNSNGNITAGAAVRIATAGWRRERKTAIHAPSPALLS